MGIDFGLPGALRNISKKQHRINLSVSSKSSQLDENVFKLKPTPMKNGVVCSKPRMMTTGDKRKTSTSSATHKSQKASKGHSNPDATGGEEADDNISNCSQLSRRSRIKRHGDLSPRRLFEEEGIEATAKPKKKQCIDDISQRSR